MPEWVYEGQLSDCTCIYSQYFNVPLDHWGEIKQNREISIFVRKLLNPVYYNSRNNELPYLLYFQGGPGLPVSKPNSPLTQWMKRAIKDYQILLLDQRGTGLSSPITHETVENIPEEEQLDYFCCFRADSIVKDCEIIRKQLQIPRWDLLGQSYGGFIIHTYLSHHPESINKAHVSGGIPPVSLSNPDQVYKMTYERVIEASKVYYKRYPEDVNRIKSLCTELISRSKSGNPALLPDGSELTVHKIQQLGLFVGMEGSPEVIHSLISMSATNVSEMLNPLFLQFIMETLKEIEDHPLYVILHESIYCQGEMSNWSADRVLRSDFPSLMITEDTNIEELEMVYFTGEMVYPWMMQEYKNLIPFASVAQSLSQKKDWKKLYDIEVLKKNVVPVSALLYINDMYVDYNLSKDTLKFVKNVNFWESVYYLHNGLQISGEFLFDLLMRKAQVMADKLQNGDYQQKLANGNNIDDRDTEYNDINNDNDDRDGTVSTFGSRDGNQNNNNDLVFPLNNTNHHNCNDDEVTFIK